MKWKKLFQKCDIFRIFKRSSKAEQGKEESESSSSSWNNIGYHPDAEQEEFYRSYAAIGKYTTCRSCKENVQDCNRCTECGEAIPKPGTSWPVVPYK